MDFKNHRGAKKKISEPPKPKLEKKGHQEERIKKKITEKSQSGVQQSGHSPTLTPIPAEKHPLP